MCQGVVSIHLSLSDLRCHANPPGVRWQVTAVHPVAVEWDEKKNKNAGQLPNRCIRVANTVLLRRLDNRDGAAAAKLNRICFHQTQHWRNAPKMMSGIAGTLPPCGHIYSGLSHPDNTGGHLA